MRGPRHALLKGRMLRTRVGERSGESPRGQAAVVALWLVLACVGCETRAPETPEQADARWRERVAAAKAYASRVAGADNGSKDGSGAAQDTALVATDGASPTELLAPDPAQPPATGQSPTRRPLRKAARARVEARERVALDVIDPNAVHGPKLIEVRRLEPAPAPPDAPF